MSPDPTEPDAPAPVLLLGCELDGAGRAVPPDLPAPIPRCREWRETNGGERYCPSVYCERCQHLRGIDGVPVIVPFTVPPTDRLLRRDDDR